MSSSESGLFDDGDVDEEYFNDEDCYFNDEDDGSGGGGGRPDPRRKRRVRGGRPSLAISARYDEAPRSRRLPGLIYVDVRVGSPPSSSVRQTLVVSTSSDYAVFPCDYDDEEEEYDEYNDNGEDGDAQRPRRFDGRYSDTFRPVGCESCFLEEPEGGWTGTKEEEDGGDGCDVYTDRCLISGTILGSKNAWTAYEVRGGGRRRRGKGC